MKEKAKILLKEQEALIPKGTKILLKGIKITLSEDLVVTLKQSDIICLLLEECRKK